MPKSTAKEPSVEVSTDELLDEHQTHLVRSALALQHDSHKEFCEEHDLNRSIFSRILTRKQVPTPPYAEPIERLLREYLRRMRFTIEEVDEGTPPATE